MALKLKEVQHLKKHISRPFSPHLTAASSKNKCILYEWPLSLHILYIKILTFTCAQCYNFSLFLFIYNFLLSKAFVPGII